MVCLARYAISIMRDKHTHTNTNHIWKSFKYIKTQYSNHLLIKSWTSIFSHVIRVVFSLPPPLHRGPTSPGCKYSNLEANQLHPPQKTNMTMPLPSMGLVYLCMFTYIYHHIYHLKTTIKFMEVNLPYLDDMGWKIMDTPYFWLVGLNLKSANNYRKLTYPFRTFERFSFPVWWDMLVSSRVYWWFGATTGLGFESGYPSLTIPFIFGDPRDPNNRAPNHQFTITVVDKEKKHVKKTTGKTWETEMMNNWSTVFTWLTEFWFKKRTTKNGRQGEMKLVKVSFLHSSPCRNSVMFQPSWGIQALFVFM